MIGQRILKDGQGTVRLFGLTVPVRIGLRRPAAIFAAGVMLTFGIPASAQDSELALQLQRVRRDLSDLQAFIYSGKAPSREAIAGIAADSNQSSARMQVQLQNLEGELRTLTGRIEEAEHNVARMSERLEKLAADIELRFQALEAGKAPAGGIGPGGAAPAPERRASVGAAGAVAAKTAPGAGPGKSAAKTPVEEGLEPGQQVFGTMSKSGSATAVKPPVTVLPENADGTPAKPGADESEQLASASGGPRQRYDIAFQYLQRREYDKAAVEFGEFVKTNPDSPLSSNALYWLGETHYFRKDYAEAARVFLDGYKRYPKGSKAPDNLFKLGKSLAAMNEKQPACAAWNKLIKTFPSANKRLLGNAKTELGKLGCA